MEALTSVAIAHELNAILKGAQIAGAEQAEGKALLIHLRLPEDRSRLQPGLQDPGEHAGSGDRSYSLSEKASPRGPAAWLVLSACAAESTLFLAKAKPVTVGTTWPAPISKHLEGKTMQSVYHPGLDRIVVISLAAPGGGSQRIAAPGARDVSVTGRRLRESGNSQSGIDALRGSEEPGKRAELPEEHIQGGRAERGDSGLLLVLELMTGRPKAILIESATEDVVEAFPSRRGDGGRSFVPGERYRRPARPAGKLDPWDLDLPALERILGPEAREDDLLNKILGVGKDLAREVQARSKATGQTPAAVLKDLVSCAAAPGAGFVVRPPDWQSAKEPTRQDRTAGAGGETKLDKEAAEKEQDSTSIEGPRMLRRKTPGAPDSAEAPEHDEGTEGVRAGDMTKPAEPVTEKQRKSAGVGPSELPRPLAYRPSFAHPLRVLSYPTVNEAARNAFLMCQQIVLDRDMRRSEAKRISIELKRATRTRLALVEELSEAKRSADLRRRGELILTHIKDIHKGQTEVVLHVAEGDGSQTMRVLLESRLGPAENAALYFKRAKKLEKKLASLPERIERVSRREARLQEELETVRQGRLSRSRSADARRKSSGGVKPEKWPTGIWPRRFLSSDGWAIYVGRNNRENDHITFVFARPEDLWFHAQGVAGSHVILRREGRKSKPSRRCIEEAASTAAYFSKGRTSQTVSVIYTERKYVRKPRKAKAGMALYSNERSVMVSPALPAAAAE